MITAHAASATDLVLAASGSDDDGGWFPYLFLLSGVGFYTLMFIRYRNVHQRHKHESETRATMHDVRAQDHFVRSLRGASNSRMSEANHTSVRGARRSFI